MAKKSNATKAPDWVEYKPSEIEDMVTQMANSGASKSSIGMTLRDQYGIPSVRDVTGKTLTEILTAHKLEDEIPEDLLNLIRKSVQVEDHLNKNGKDMTAKRGFQLTVSKIRRLVKYYQKTGRLPRDWRYTPEKARLLVK